MALLKDRLHSLLVGWQCVVNRDSHKACRVYHGCDLRLSSPATLVASSQSSHQQFQAMQSRVADAIATKAKGFAYPSRVTEHARP
jgi:hypothetical protein